MADGRILRGGSKKINKDVQISNLVVDCNQIDCRDITYDGERFKWTSGWETLKNFIEHDLKLKGRWTSPGGSSRKFTGKNLDLTITWYPGKRNSLILHGGLSSSLSNILLKACQRKSDITLAEINNPSKSLNDNQTSIPDHESKPKPMMASVECQSESTCLQSLCNVQCDCSCSLLVAELEGVKLDIAIMQRSIESNIALANITRTEEVEQLRQALVNEREKNRKLEEDISVLVRGRNSEISELNDIIESLQNKLESKGFVPLHKQPQTAGNEYADIHKFDNTIDDSTNETIECLLSKQYSSYCSSKQDVSSLCLNKEDGIERKVNSIQTHNYVSQEKIPPVYFKSKAYKKNQPSVNLSLQDLANSKPNGNTIDGNNIAFLPLIDSSIFVQHLNNQCLQHTINLEKRSATPHQSIDEQLKKSYFRNRHRTRPPHIRDRQCNSPNTPWFRYIIQRNSPDWIKHLELVTRITAHQRPKTY